jgi:6-phosphogluconolactonase
MKRTRVETVVRRTVLFAVSLFVLGCEGGRQGPTLDPADLATSQDALHRSSGAVFVLTNEAAGNAVQAFTRAPDGELTPADRVPTGGLGSGAGLGSQGALVFSSDHRWLFAVNAGSNDVSVFRVRDARLELTDREPSGGTMPISVTSHDGLLYVLNAGAPENLSGFRVGSDGTLHALAGATRPLSASGVMPAQVSFGPNGESLVVTEKATNRVLTYGVDDEGLASLPTIHHSQGMTPFGFDIGRRGELVVSEAAGGAAGASTASSYLVKEVWGTPLFGTLSAAVPSGETAACWTVLTPDDDYAFITNTGSHSVSSYRLSAGRLTGPIDEDVAAGGRYLYVLNSMSHDVSAFVIQHGGMLAPIGRFGALPSSTVGLVSR